MMKVWIGCMVIAGMMTAAADELSDAKAEFAKQDKALNATYEVLKKELAPGLFAKLKEDQRQWVDYRDFMTGRTGDADTTNLSTEKAAEQLTTAAGITESRIEWLKAWKKVDQRKGWSGSYTDSRGGLLEIVEKDGTYWFALSVVRGPSFHIGHLGGKIRVNGSTAWFETKADGEENPTWITLLNALDYPGSVRVMPENAQHFHGARGYFDGTYLWTGELTEKERKEVIEGKLE